ncbi:hypothetical protein BC833DRAFT_598851 [Globomyces pollinis-pini]|nr:hypothetical protein BC833DRAFT_598851 [Globomyces pollinis-pini]
MVKAYSILDELIIAGEFSESSLKKVVKRVRDIEVTEAEESLMENLGMTVTM